MKLVSILNEELIFPEVEGATRGEIYRNMLQKAQNAIPMAIDVDATLKAMMSREDTLCMPYERLALPHLRDARFDDLYIIIGMPQTPVKLQPNDLEPSRVVVMSLISPDTSDLYLKSLAALARFTAQPENFEQLASAATSADFLEVLRKADVRVRSHLVAEDLLIARPGLKPDDSLSTALDLFSRDDRGILPVVDNENRLIGELTALDILKRFIPEYVFMMDNLDFLTSFEPFNRIFQEESTHLVRDFMREPSLVVHRDTPLIQFTVKMAKKGVRTCFVVDENRRYLGEVMVKNIIKKVLRG